MSGPGAWIEELQFLPEQGKIFLKRSRMIVTDAESLGKLRQDLLETLGPHRARSFLVRYGWSCGFAAATSIKEHFPPNSALEWLQAAASMPAVTGRATVDLKILSHDPWLFQATMHNSFEAEHQIRQFGRNLEPSCWMLAGYASGYGTAVLGKQIVFKEVACAAQGNENCIFIGKTTGDWGEEIAPELAYYHVSKIREELETLQTQKNTLEKIANIHERLTQCILSGQRSKDITDTLAELMKCTVVLEDPHLAVYCTCISESAISRDILIPYLPILNSPSFNKSSAFYLKQKRAFQIIDEYPGLSIYRLVSPIQVDNRLLGYVSMLRPEKPFADLDNIVLERAASLFAIRILMKKEIAEVERRLKGDFIEDLLSENFTDADSIIYRARGLDYDITRPHRVLVLDIHDFTKVVKYFKHNEIKILQFKTDIVSTVQSCLEGLGTGIVVYKGGNLIMLVQLDKAESPEKDTRQMAERIIEHVSPRFPEVVLSVGIGTVCKELADFHHSFESAQKAIEIGKALEKHGQVVSLEQFGSLAMLFSALNPTDLYRFATSQIGTLLAHDESFQSQLIPTLRQFLNHRGSLEETARSMNMSLSGLRYRLQRIKDISGHNLKNSQTFFNLHLALEILQLAGKDKVM